LRLWNIVNLLVLVALFQFGCASRSAVLPLNDIAGESEVPPMVALEGYRDDQNFFVKYRFGDRILYAGGDWRDRIELIDGPPPENYATPSLVPMQYHQETRWESLPSEAISIPIFGIEQWRLLRDRLLRSVVPDDGTGLVVDFEYAEYFLFYGRDGVFQAMRFQDKPAYYTVKERLHFVEFMRRGRPVLDAFLRENQITHTEFVFNTGDTGLYSLPFLFINTERRLLAFVRNVPLRPLTTTRVPGLKGSATATVSFDWATGLADKPVPALADAPPMDLKLWEAELDKIADHPLSSGSVDILVNGEAYFTRFIDTVSSAEKSVRLQTYIFDNDDYAVKIGELLKRRSNEGVEVKVLLDGLGTISGTMSESGSLPDDHAPPVSVRLFLESDSRVMVRQKANPWFTGDHVKSTIIDEEIAFVGGMNIGREYRYDWHDLMIEIQGPVVDVIDREFKLAWGHAGPLGDLGYLIAQASPRKDEVANGGSPLRVLLTGPGNYEIYTAQLKAIRRAQRFIYIQNAYFTDDSLLRELVMARRRGVDVRVIVPMETDHGPITRSNVLAANLMLKHGIRVFIYPGFSHVKAAIYDGWICVGSANFDRLSLRINRELNIASSAPEVADQLLERLFEPDFRGSPELIEPIPERWVDYLVEIIGDYLY
jgi:cardiolipin synthase